ncbi:MAG: DUF4054 domain-containing protein [Acinetobacter sp.]
MDLVQFKARYPLINATDDQIQAVLDEADLLVKASVWGNRRELALGLYAAHVLTLETSPSGQSGQAVQTASRKKVGDVEIQYSTSSQDSEKAWFDLTLWGQRYWALLQSLPVGVGAFVI